MSKKKAAKKTTRFLAGGKLRRGPTPNPIPVDTMYINPSEPPGGKKKMPKKKGKKSPKRNSKGQFVKSRTSNPKPAKKRGKAKSRKKNAWKGDREGHQKAAKKGWSNRRAKAEAAMDSGNLAEAERLLGMKKRGKRGKSKSRTANPSTYRSKPRKGRGKVARRRNPQITIDLDFQKITDALPATIAGAFGFTFAGIVDAVGGGKISEKIGEYFAGKDKNGKQNPLDYKARAQGRAVLDVGMFFGLWGLSKLLGAKAGQPTNLVDEVRTPVLIGSGIRAVRSIFDAILDPKPDTITAGIRRVMALPEIQMKALPPTADIAGKLKLVTYDPAKKKFVDLAGNEVPVTFLANGIATAADGSVLLDAHTQTVIKKDEVPQLSGAMGSVYEEWDLVMGGPEAGYEMDGYEAGYEMGDYEDWIPEGNQYRQVANRGQRGMSGDLDVSIHHQAQASHMDAYEEWDHMGEGPEAGYEMGDYENWESMGAYDDPYAAEF